VGGRKVETEKNRMLLGDVPLMLVDAAKAVETSPNGIALGAIRLRSWHLRRVEPVPPDLDGRHAYLVRVNYEFDIAPDVPAPEWAEIGFKFGDPEVLVLDALPRAVTGPVEAARYELTRSLAFAPAGHAGHGGAADDVSLPAQPAPVECSGIGGNHVRWRHSGQVPPGSRTGCLALIAPPDFTTLQVVAHGEYHLATEPRLKLRPVGRKDAFEVRLPPPHPASPSPTPARVEPRDAWAEELRPRVFVSYAQESEEHKQAVTALCALLRRERVDVRFDQEGLEQRRDWDEWTTTHILRSDYVIAIASPAYRDVGNRQVPPGRNRGLISEYVRLADLLHRDREQWTRRILPVVLPGRSPEEIPLSFLPGIGDYYAVDDFTPAGAADLLTVLRNSAVDR
jgi:TIR domain